MGVQTGFDELLVILSLLAPDLVPALAIPTVVLVFSAATALGWNGAGLAERLFGKLCRRN